MSNKLKKPEAVKPKKIESKRKHSGKGSANERLQRDMAIARQTTDRNNP